MDNSFFNICDGKNVVEFVQKRLFEKADLKYRDFQSALMPTVDKNAVIGVRTPELRKFTKEIAGTPLAQAFMNVLPHAYYEENNLHAFLLCGIKDFDKCEEELERFLPFVDNWATCDAMTIKAYEKNPSRAGSSSLERLKSDKTYTVRFAIVTLMKLFTAYNFDKRYSDAVAAVKSDEYYVNAAIAWFFATLLTKRYSDGLPYITENALSKVVHNLAIKKACESLAIPKERKDYLRTLKI